MQSNLKVVIIFGSKSDLQALAKADYKAKQYFQELCFEVSISFASAHRNPEELEAFLKRCWSEGIRYYVAVAGMAAHLAGKIASTLRCAVVYAVPIASDNFGVIDALTGSLQMPPLVPVRTMTPGKVGLDQTPICLAQDIAVFNTEISGRLKAFFEGHNIKAQFDMSWEEAEANAVAGVNKMT